MHTQYTKLENHTGGVTSGNQRNVLDAPPQTENEVTVTKEHNHAPSPTRNECLIIKHNVKGSATGNFY